MEIVAGLKQVDGQLSLMADRVTGVSAKLEDLLYRAQRIAARIADYHREYPDQPVTLIGYSGGGGLAVMATEALPKDILLDRLILVGAAVAPDHDLSGVLPRCAHGVINFYSAADWFILGVGTQVFGTIDRKYTSSAGHVGFLDGDGKLREAPGLTQIAWEPAWINAGHDGGHIGWLAYNPRDWMQLKVNGFVTDTLDRSFPTVAGQTPTAATNLDKAINRLQLDMSVKF